MYGVDSSGSIIFLDSLDDIHDQYGDIYDGFFDSDNFVPEESNSQTIPGDVSSDTSNLIPEEDNSLTIDDMFSVSSGDIPPEIHIDYSEPIDYDYLYDLLAAIPQYNLYPNATAVNIFTQVLNGLDKNVHYVISAGSISGDTYLYYSKDVNVSGNTITLKSPVTQCRYYYYTQNSTTNYTYNVIVLNSDQTISLSNRLVYTNVVEGYPDVIPYKSKESFSIGVCGFILVGAICTSIIRKVVKNYG